MKYRIGGKEKLLAFGNYPLVTLKEAREQRDEAKRALARGEDPSKLKRVAKAQAAEIGQNTVQAIGLDWLAIKKDAWSDTHFDREQRNLLKDVFPYLGKRPIRDIEPPDLLRVIRKVEESWPH